MLSHAGLAHEIHKVPRIDALDAIWPLAGEKVAVTVRRLSAPVP